MRKKKRFPDRLDELDLVALFSHLKDCPDKPHSKRVERVLELLSYLGGAEKELKNRDKKGLPRFTDTHHGLRVMDAVTKLRRLLVAYRWTRQVCYTKEGFRAITFAADRHELSRDDEWEYGAMRDLLELTEYPDALSRIRRCAVCRDWLFAASRSNQRFCSGKCRQYEYDNDPDRKEQHRANMRRLYRTEKDLRERAKAGVAVRSHRKRK